MLLLLHCWQQIAEKPNIVDQDGASHELTCYPRKNLPELVVSTLVKRWTQMQMLFCAGRMDFLLFQFYNVILSYTCIKFPQIEKNGVTLSEYQASCFICTGNCFTFCNYTCSGKLTKKLLSLRDYTPYQTQAIETNNARDLSLPLLFCVTVWNVFLPFLSSPSYWETHKQ